MGEAGAWRRAGSWLAENHGWLLILSCVALLPTKALFNAPMLIMAVLGVVRLVRDPAQVWADGRIRWMVVLFACLWLPVLLAAFDGVDLRRAVRTALDYLRFPLAGVYIAHVLAQAQARARLLTGTAVVVGLWCADALVQWVAGRNLLGYPYDGARLTGVFHPKFRIGFVVAVLTPVYLEAVRAWAARQPMAWALVLPLVLTVLLSGTRTAWLGLAVAGLVWGGWWYATAPRRIRGRAAAAIAVLCLAGITLVPALPGMATRLEASRGLLQGDYETLDSATSHRLPLWQAAVAMASVHWINGVGARGYRVLYPEYAPAGDVFREDDALDAVTHPHLQILEIAVETGAMGLAGYLVFVVLVLRLVRRSAAGRARVLGLATLVAVFPFNAHMAFYASYWATVVWWLTLVSCAVLADGRVVPPGSQRPATVAS